MTVYEYGKQNDKQVLFIATAALEPYWVFQKQAESLGEDYHVYIGVGEKIEDLQRFNPDEYVDALFYRD